MRSWSPNATPSLCQKSERQPERTGIVRVHQKSQDQPGAKVEPSRRTTAPDRRAQAVHRKVVLIFQADERWRVRAIRDPNGSSAVSPRGVASSLNYAPDRMIAVSAIFWTTVSVA
jgi:hypothetical protein